MLHSWYDNTKMKFGFGGGYEIRSVEGNVHVSLEYFLGNW